jgi:S-adenosylmethionine-diacylglycerol 3-amino-3-carboxypropyl transferase
MGKSRYFERLNYTLGDEDSAVEHGMLRPGASHVVAVAGSGGRVVPLLAGAPETLTCVDVSPAQLELTRFRLAAVAEVEREEYLGLLGYEAMPLPRRVEIARALGWNTPSGVVERLLRSRRGLIYEGRFERMLSLLGRLSRRVLGRRGEMLFRCQTSEEQRRFLAGDFPRRRWDLLIFALGNSAVLNALLYRGAFPKKNRPGSHAQIYRSMFDGLLRNSPARLSFFLQMLLLGKLRFAEGYPAECTPEVFAAAKQAAKRARVNFLCGDIVRQVASSRDVEFVSLSDVPSFMLERDAVQVLQAMKGGIRRGGTVVMRGHMRVIDPASDGFSNDAGRYRDLIENEKTGLWQIDAFVRA